MTPRMVNYLGYILMLTENNGWAIMKSGQTMMSGLTLMQAEYKCRRMAGGYAY